MATALEASFLVDAGIHVELTHDLLDVQSVMNRVKSPKAGAVVIFAGTTRDTFGMKQVKQLQYSAYIPLALSTMMKIAKDVIAKHELIGIALVHRLGVVPVGEESILIAVSSPHRQAAWHAGEETLELTKEKVEVWKLEEFEGTEAGAWRANRDGQAGHRVN